MSKSLFDLETLIEGLKQQRDELKVQFNLAQSEARDEWDKLERKWEDVRNKSEAIRKETAHTTEEVVEATKLVAEEIKRGYERLRKLLP